MAERGLRPLLEEVRRLLMDVTPLKKDCGLLCGAACCQSLPGEKTGMFLFPGEEAFYADLDGFSMDRTESGQILYCRGICRRADRPIACRIFPLLPVVRNGKIQVEVDRGSRSVCVLSNQPMEAFDSSFVDAVYLAGNLLMQNPDAAAHLTRLTRAQDAWKALQQRMGVK